MESITIFQRKESQWIFQAFEHALTNFNMANDI